mmetsp:Transcript_51513/g.124030  ORF Transcript_51513/g.124030 Transcript_51513/m.124030 type:complete len:106 (-) Transcript_51513:66-383(-)
MISGSGSEAVASVGAQAVISGSSSEAVMSTVMQEAVITDGAGIKDDCLPAKSVLEGRSLNWGHLWSPSAVQAETELSSELGGGVSDLVGPDEVPRRIALELEFAN